MTPKEKWVLDMDLVLGGILFRGYHTKETNAGMLFREEEQGHARMIECLRKIYDQFNPPAPLPVNPQPKGKP